MSKNIQPPDPDGINDDNEEDDEIEFMPCAKCDGHPACEDFGCAFKLGKGNMVKKDTPEGLDDWT